MTDSLQDLTTMSHDLIFLHGGHQPRCVSTVNKRFDGYHALQFMTRGRLELWYDQRRFDLAGPTVWPTPPGPLIRFHRAPGPRKCPWWEHRYVAFKGAAVEHWKAEGLWLSGPQIIRNGAKMARRFDELLSRMQRTDSWGNRIAVNMLEGILLDLADQRGPANEAAGDPWLDHLLARLEQCIDKPETDYEQLASEQAMSVSTLRRRFRQTTGTPIHTYLLQLRMSEARRLLGDDDLPIKRIAEQLGYNDVFYFSRQFRQITGVPPATYRRSRQR
ncbi:MAG: AraC family transcriptional regulator [Phycisphaeraceae bacterium]